ncbi:MAG: MlaD family protein [Gemmatimonadota bacterium]|nr:MlaD family protein [Gemmatimonadota bacterium]
MTSGDSRVGIVAFLGATALVLLALVAFARYPSLFRGGMEYHSVFRSVPGINLGDEVRYGGLLVGSITSLALDEDDSTRIRVSFRVRGGTPIRGDTRVAITQVGLLGAPYLNLTPGRVDAPPLPPGSTLVSEDNLTFQDAMSRLAQFLDRADTLIGGVERLTSGSPLERIDRTLARMDSLVINANLGSARVFAGLDTSTLRLNDVLARTERLIATLDTTVSGARPGFASAQEEAVAAMRDTRALVAELRDALGRGERIDAIVRDLSSAADNVARLSARLENDPSSVLRSRRPPSKPAGPQPRD